MKIYITGIAGMLGWGICQMVAGKAQVTGIDIVEINIPNVKYKVGSLFEYQEVEKHIQKEKPDLLIHTAAFVNVDECETNPELAQKLNVDATRELAKLCKRYGIKMVYISTDAVFDGRNSKLYTEEDKVNPINIYGKTKLDAETYVLEESNNLVFRTNIYGMNIQNKKSFGEWIYTSLDKDQTLNMFTDIDFSPILVTELAEIILLAYEKNLKGLYHVCGTGSITKYDFGVTLKKIFRIKKGEIVPSISSASGLVAKRSKHMGMSNQKICDELGIRISTPEESLRKFYDLIIARDKNEN